MDVDVDIEQQQQQPKKEQPTIENMRDVPPENRDRDNQKIDSSGSNDGDDENDAGGAGAAIKQTRAMLDMIITIVGEYYGQRDLLTAREIWDEEDYDI